MFLKHGANIKDIKDIAVWECERLHPELTLDNLMLVAVIERERTLGC